MRILGLAWIVAAGALLQIVAPAAAERPLPEPAPFYEAVRQNVARAQREQNRYAYKERRTDVHTNPFGRIGTGGTRVFDVVPAPDGRTAMRQFIERNDVPMPASPGERINLPQRRNALGSRSVDDISQTLAFTIARREVADGHSSIVVEFEPRPNAKPTTRQGRLAQAFKGRMWVSEAAHEIERVEATAVRDMSFGLGFVARVRKGATVTAERKPVEGGVWMPTSLRFNGEGRAVLFRKLDLDYAVDWFDYRLVPDAR